MEFSLAMGAALIGIVIVYKALKGIVRTIGLAVVAIGVAAFLYTNGAFG